LDSPRLAGRWQLATGDAFGDDVQRLHQLGPAIALAAHEAVELRHRHPGFRDGAQRQHALRDFGLLQHRLQVAVDARHDVGGRAGRREQPFQPVYSKPGKVSPSVGTLGSSDWRCAGADRQRLDLAALDVRGERRIRQAHQLHAAADHVLQRVGRLGVRHVVQLDAGHRGDAVGQHAGEGLGPFGGDADRAGLRLGLGDHFGQVLGREVRRRGDHEGAAAHQAHRHEVLHRVVGQRLEGVDVGHHRRGRRVVEGVAIGGERAAAWAPITFWPPGLLSMMTGWFQVRASWSPR
jgi:hypothetical protein